MSFLASYSRARKALTAAKLRKHGLIGLTVATTSVFLAVSASTPATAAPITARTVSLGSAANFSVLAAAAATVPGSLIPGELGAEAAITDDAGTRYGSTRHLSNDAATRAAVADALDAYTALQDLPVTGTLAGDDLAGQIVLPGVYHRVAAYAVTTDMSFDAQGDSNAYFIMQSEAALNTTAATTIKLVNGAQASHVFWVVRGAATLGASSTFNGTILSAAAITVGATSHINGRLLSVAAAVTLDADILGPVTEANPGAVSPLAVFITGGAVAVLTNTQALIAGTSNAPSGATITVIAEGVTYTTKVSREGTWSIPVVTLGEGSHTVTASTTLADGTSATYSQILKVTTPKEEITVASTVIYFAAGLSSLTVPNNITGDTSIAQIEAVAAAVPAAATNVTVEIKSYVKLPASATPTTLAKYRASAVSSKLKSVLDATLNATYIVANDGTGAAFDESAQSASLVINWANPTEASIEAAAVAANVAAAVVVATAETAVNVLAAKSAAAAAVLADAKATAVTTAAAEKAITVAIAAQAVTDAKAAVLVATATKAAATTAAAKLITDTKAAAAAAVTAKLAATAAAVKAAPTTAAGTAINTAAKAAAVVTAAQVAAAVTAAVPVASALKAAAAVDAAKLITDTAAAVTAAKNARTALVAANVKATLAAATAASKVAGTNAANEVAAAAKAVATQVAADAADAAAAILNAAKAAKSAASKTAAK